MNNLKKVNVAPSSEEGHFVENATKVIDLDSVNEAFLVTGKSVLKTKNHTTLKMNDSCLIICQQVVNPLNGLIENAKD